MRFWLCLALTACAGSPSTDSSEPPRGAAPITALVTTAKNPSPASLSSPPPTAAPVGPKAPAGPITAPHGSDIIALATLDDGSAVVSADLHGGLRLWPVLDGTREPAVIIAPAAKSLALVRDGDGFAIAVRDAAGGLHVIRTAGSGAVRERITVAGDAAVTELDATTERLLALRADQTIDVIAPTGVTVARLTAEPGSHVDAIVTRGRRALALLLEDKQVHGRWIELASGAAWGGLTGKIPGKVASAALSPGGALLAINRPRSIHPQLFDLAHGKPLDTPLCVAKGWPQSEGFQMDEAELLREGTAPVALGFFADGIVACSVMTQLTWWSTGGEAITSRAASMTLGASPVAVTSSAVMMGQGGSLGISTIVQTRFLGYGLHSIAHLHTGPGGALVSSDSATVELDGGLALRTRFETGRGRSDWADAIPLDDRFALTLRPQRSYHPEQFALAVFDGAAGTEHQALPYDVRTTELSYEPSTRLLATDDGGNAILVQLDPEGHTFGAPTRIGDRSLAGKLRAIAPALSDGVAALKIDDATGAIKVSEIDLADVVPGGVATPARSYRVPGELRAVDRAGRLYMRDSEQGDVTIYRRGVPVGTLRGMAALSLRPNADGSRIAAYVAPRLVLLDGAGRVLWDVQHWDNRDVGWLADGRLVAAFTTGMAAVDLANGSLVQRRCGWSFGLSEQGFDQDQPTASLCDIAK